MALLHPLGVKVNETVVLGGEIQNRLLIFEDHFAVRS